jgi:hypothetical protein
VRRIVIGCTTLVLALGAALGVALVLAGRGALETGEALYHHRHALSQMVRPVSGERPLVAWLGDSTIVSVGQDTYPRLVGEALAGDGAAGEQRVIATPGLNPFDYYFVMGPVLRGTPDLVVLVAHLRMFGGNPGTRTFTDLASMIPASELPTAVMLPLPEKGISVPRLFLLRTLRLAPIERAVYLLEGLRSRFQDAAWWDVLGPRTVVWDVTTAMRALPETVPNMLRAYDVPVGPRHAMVRMMGATVRMAARRGVPVLVVGSPIPYEHLREAGLYDPEVYARRFAAMRDVVEAAGGEFLDLHESLPAGEFRDNGGHYTEAGTRRLATLIEPVVRRLLEARRKGGPAPEGTTPAA